MIINRGDDLILRLHLKDDKGKRIRVEEKPSFYVKVFTSNKKNCLLYYKEQIKHLTYLEYHVLLLFLLCTPTPRAYLYSFLCFCHNDILLQGVCYVTEYLVLPVNGLHAEFLHPTFLETIFFLVQGILV